MNNQVNYLAVGLFVLAMVGLVLLLVFWLARDAAGELGDRYLLKFENDVTGLAAGGPVRFMGVQVGRVERIQLSETYPPMVEVTININPDTRVTDQTYATLALQGITGTSFINLASDGEAGEPLTASRDRLPEIPTREGGITALLEAAPELMSNANGLIEDLRGLASEENRDRVQRLLNNLDRVSGALADGEEALAGLPGELRAAMEDIRAILDQADDLVSEARPDLNQSLDNLREASADLADATDTISEWIQSNDEPVRNLVRDSLAELPELLQEARQTLHRFEQLAGSLQRQPSRLIYKQESNEVQLQESQP